MKETRKIYQTPTLKAFRLRQTLMYNAQSSIASGGESKDDNVEVDSKAFWGGSLFDDEDEEEFFNITP